MATRMSAGRAALATWSTPTQASSTSWRLSVGGIRLSCSARAVMAASSAPAAPMQCPCMDLVALTATRAAASSPRACWRIRDLGRVAGLARSAVRVDVVHLIGAMPASWRAAHERTGLGHSARLRIRRWWASALAP